MVKNDSVIKYYGLRDLRQLLGLSQEELSVGSGITVGHLASIEVNGRKFTKGTAKKVSMAISNMLTQAMWYGFNEKQVDEKVKKVGAAFRSGESKANAEFKDPEYVEQEVTILPESLIVSHEANFFPAHLQDKAFELLISNQLNLIRLSEMRDAKKDLSEEEQVEMEGGFKQKPEALINRILQDKYYKIGYDGVLKDLRDHIRKSAGFFLSGDDQDD